MAAVRIWIVLHSLFNGAFISERALSLLDVLMQPELLLLFCFGAKMKARTLSLRWLIGDPCCCLSGTRCGSAERARLRSAPQVRRWAAPPG